MFRQRVLSPAAQVKDFKGYIRKLKGIVGKKKAKEIVANSVILVSEGNNDIGITYAIHDAGMRLMTPNIYTSKLVGWNKKFIKVRQRKRNFIHQYYYICTYSHFLGFSKCTYEGFI